jgi:hypothetical protein
MNFSRLNVRGLIVFLVFVFSLNTIVLGQVNPLKGTVVIRKKITLNKINMLEKMRYSNTENPLAGKWKLQRYIVNKKKISLNNNSHVLEFYDSTFHFRRIYTKPMSRVFEGTFPVNVLRDNINRSSENDTVKLERLRVYDYHLLYIEDSMVARELGVMFFEQFTYTSNLITFVVKEHGERNLVIRTLFFEYARIKD